MVDKGTFREDLYYRLNVFPIHVPPLRERKEDIEPLINYYMQIYNRKYNRHVMINDKDIRLLSDYSWPGNIRELKNVIQRYIITDGHFFLDSTSTTNYHRDVTPQIFPDTKKDSTTPESIEFKDYIASCEKKYFEEILSLTNGDVSKAAAIAHLHISSIYKKCDAFGLVPKDYKNNSI